jgi:hypothetical protein
MDKVCAILAEFDVTDIYKGKTFVRFNLAPDGKLNQSQLKTRLECICLEGHEVNSLQTMILSKLNTNPRFQLDASIFYAAKHGHADTFHVLDTIDTLFEY